MVVVELFIPQVVAFFDHYVNRSFSFCIAVTIRRSGDPHLDVFACYHGGCHERSIEHVFLHHIPPLNESLLSTTIYFCIVVASQN